MVQSSPFCLDVTPKAPASPADGRSAAARRVWQARSPESAISLTEEGRAKARGTFAAAERAAEGLVPAEMEPAERYRSVQRYTKRLNGRREASTSSVPVQDALAEAILGLYAENPSLRAEDASSAVVEKRKPRDISVSLSDVRRDAAAARWDGATGQQRREATQVRRDAAMEARRRRAEALLQELQAKESDGSLSPAERIAAVRSYKGRVKRRGEPLCPELDLWASKILDHYSASPQSRKEDLLAVRRERMQHAAETSS